MHSIIDSLSNELGDTKVINVNCMALSNIDALWDRLIDEFEGVLQRKRIKKGRGRDFVESMLDGMSARWLVSCWSIQS